MANSKDPAVEAVLEDFAPGVREGLRTQLNGINSLATAHKTAAVAVSENVFKRDILPMLTKVDNERPFTQLLDIIGSWYAPIDVMDDDSGDFLFKVPPLLRSINSKFDTNSSISNILDTAHQKASIMQQLGDVHITKELTEKFVHETVDVSDVVAWNNILKRYGIEPIIKDLPDIAPSDVSVKTEIPQVVEYEEI